MCYLYAITVLSFALSDIRVKCKHFRPSIFIHGTLSNVFLITMLLCLTWFKLLSPSPSAEEPVCLIHLTDESER